MTAHEQLMAAILAALATTGAKVVRNAEVPTTVPAEGLVILRDGDPGEPEVCLSPLTYTFHHAVQLEAYAQASVKSVRTTTLDGLVSAIGTALAADRTFAGLADWSMPGGPTVTDHGSTGAQSVAAATIPLTVIHTTTDPLL